MKYILVAILLFVSGVAIAAEPDPRLAQIQQQRQETMNQMIWAQQVINAVGILEQGQIKLRDLNEEERKIKSETKIEAKPKGE